MPSGGLGCAAGLPLSAHPEPQTQCDMECLPGRRIGVLGQGQQKEREGLLVKEYGGSEVGLILLMCIKRKE